MSQPGDEVDPVDADGRQRDGEDDRQRQDEALEQEAHQQVDEDDREEAARSSSPARSSSKLCLLPTSAPKETPSGRSMAPRISGQPLAGLLLAALLQLEGDACARSACCGGRWSAGVGRNLRLGQRRQRQRPRRSRGHQEVGQLGQALAVLLLEAHADRDLLAVLAVLGQRRAASARSPRRRRRPRVDAVALGPLAIDHQRQLVGRAARSLPLTPSTPSTRTSRSSSSSWPPGPAVPGPRRCSVSA